MVGPVVLRSSYNRVGGDQRMACSFMWRCPKRLETLPNITCDSKICEWRIKSPGNRNCFWVLADHLQDMPMTVEEIAQVEGISVEEVEKVTQEALQKLRSNPESMQLLLTVSGFDPED